MLDDEKPFCQLLNEACKIILKERWFRSHQCGLASCHNGNELTEDQKWAKIDQARNIAFEFWGECKMDSNSQNSLKSINPNSWCY
jgi:hypothetical protein